ncbi:hypothetical protein SAMN05421848_2300 [Kushneria avicenniae]|uniref:Uncharacterized protein n=1 Tax=Kushneria avicenniae TaxID=402385 RepID=A0A1I1L0A1_9GAMM|nr:hypothetical protein [Kushneria avicenniae]SFC66479.1 hypothetical protein SAMN05421848_2300 [Kushneria avicenniae]
MSEGVLHFFFITSGAILTLLFFPLLVMVLWKILRRWREDKRSRH